MPAAARAPSFSQSASPKQLLEMRKEHIIYQVTIRVIAMNSHEQLGKKGDFKVENTLDSRNKQAPELHLDELEISEVSIAALTTEDSIGIPDLGASASYYSCTFC
jgi:hypothetical protein